MAYLIVCLVALLVAALTLFSGFGLGTLLMPAFALFFPVPVAVAATAVVHLANNLFKLGLVGRHADRTTVIRFGVPAAVAAIVGALVLNLTSALPPLTTYVLRDQTHAITPVKLIVGLLILAFALFDLIPKLAGMTFDQRYLPLGGALSGFFGGLSGNQGAMRSAFLLKLGLDKQAFVGTGVVTAVIVDVTRLLIYGLAFFTVNVTAFDPSVVGLVLAATVAAFVGSFLGARLLTKVTLRTVQIIVGILLMALGVGMAAGLV
ncbi:MAG: sulfite exporter TauE/SafE family protein [Chloroflexi bacterium]|nr:sulfite exporter TauE/SafE family protein [Chloroflexota bacterium]